METIVKTPEEVITPPTPEVVVTPPAPAVKPGEKTDPAVLLEALHDERAKRRAAEAALAAKDGAPGNGAGQPIPEVKALDARIAELEGKLSVSEQKELLTQAQTAYPAIKDKEAEFEEFRNLSENKGMSLVTAAKAFVFEKDLIEKPQARKGLEDGTGGPRTVIKTGMTAAEADELRTTNYNEYARRVREGTLVISD